MRRWFAILGILFLAACQQPAGTAPVAAPLGTASSDDEIPSDWSGLGESEESKYFAEEFKQTRGAMLATLLGNCYRTLGDRAKLDRCLRTQLADTFDEAGDGRRYCEAQSDLDAYTDCIILGNVALDVAHRMDSSVKPDPAIWSGRKAFADFVGKVAVVNAVSACSDAKTEASVTACTLDWLVAKLDLPENLSSKCPAKLVAQERGGCLYQAAMLRFVQDHLARAGGTDT